MSNRFVLKDFIIITLIVSLWVNISEVFRYFVIVRPEMHINLSVIPNVADMNLTIFLIWGFWDTLLTALFVFLFWLCANSFGNNYKTIIMSGLVSWCFFFVLFWVGMANMNLSNWMFLFIVLPLALIETIVASFIASKLYCEKIPNKQIN
jgi:hypothetical protein